MRRRKRAGGTALERDMSRRFISLPEIPVKLSFRSFVTGGSCSASTGSCRRRSWERTRWSLSIRTAMRLWGSIRRSSKRWTLRAFFPAAAT